MISCRLTYGKQEYTVPTVSTTPPDNAVCASVVRWLCLLTFILHQPVFLNLVQAIHHKLSPSGNEKQLPITLGDPEQQSICSALLFAITTFPSPPQQPTYHI
jgi:hypothetical protein